MSKQIYIDSNGNEIQVSGTVNTADMMPMSGNDSTKVSEAIGDLSQLTTADKSSIVGAINELVATSKLNPVYGNTASGAIATFDTSLALPLQDCKIAINAVQESGTPTPSSPKLISGFTGANIKVAGSNLWDEDWELGNISTSDGQPSTSTLYIRSKVYCACKGGATYYCKSHSTSQLVIYWYSANDTYLGFDVCINTTKTAPANAVKFKIRCEVTTYSNDISINYPATDTAYHPYNANSTTTAITWQSEAGTVYGGSLDVTSGVLTVTHRYRLMQSDAPNFIENIMTNYTTYYTKLSNLYTDIKVTGFIDVISDKFVGVKTSAGNDTNIVYIQSGYANFRVNNGDFASASDFKTWVQTNGIELVYELATPVTYQLTPTQISAIVGTNNIFTDTNGNTSVMYACSLKDYIDSQ